MDHDSIIQRQSGFFAAATIAAHASSKSAGFRQRDVVFLIELFTNWIEIKDRFSGYSVRPTHIHRYLNNLVAEGLARKSVIQKSPCYRITRTGLVELVSGIVSKTYLKPRGHFFFFYYFISNYHQLIKQLIQLEGNLFPVALRYELEQLFDANAFLERELAEAQREVQRLNIRISDSIASDKITHKRKKEGVPFTQIIQEVQQLHPYELNSQRPLSELLSTLPEALQEWEMGTGMYFRSKQIWEPSLELLLTYIKLLEALKSGEKNKIT